MPPWRQSDFVWPHTSTEEDMEKICGPVNLRDYMAPLSSGLNNASNPTVPCHCNLGRLSLEKKKSESRHHLALDDDVCERVCVCVCVCVWVRASWRVCVEERGEAWERGLHVEIEKDQLKHNIGLIFLIAFRLRRAADAAVCANSCLPKKIGQNKLWEGGKNNAGWIIRSLWGILQFHNFEKCTRDYESFIGNSHLLQGAFPRELAKMHFLCCLSETETVWCITAQSKLKQTMCFFFFQLC